MTDLILALVAVVVFMALQDAFGSGLTISQARGLRVFPGLFDALGDLVSRYGGGISAFAVVRYGIQSWQFFAITAACAITSFFTSNIATAKESAILPKDRLEKVALSDLWQRFKATFQ